MKDISFLKENIISHRGIHDNKNGTVENTIEAFEKAIQKQYIIELDVHLLKDQEIIVFHDDNLMRLAQINKPVKDMTYEEIKKIKLCDTNTYIPKLVDVLDFIDGRVPVLIEIKYDNKVGSLEKKLVSILEKYSGKYALQSFNPFTIKWLRDNAPHIIRGQLASDFKSEKMSLIKKFLLKNMVFNFLGQPDFISYKVEDLDRKKAKKIREKRILLGWTVRDRKEYEKLSQYYDNLICEDFI